jgi:predicted SAM-dependent methyltransferase
MNELIKKGIKNWRNIKLSNLKSYLELLKEEMGRFKYPPHGIKKYTINIFKLNRIKKLLKYSNKLHIGCGGVKIDGFINIDVFKTQATDFVCEIEDLPKYIKPNSIMLIYSSHTLEHFSRKDSIQVLKMFWDLLEPLGELRISVPDLLKLSDIVKTRKLEIKEMETIQGVLMGGQDTRYNYHKSIYWFDLLKQILLDIGFKNISEYPSYPHFLGDIKDASSIAGKPDLGVYISLNVKGTK